MHQDQEKQMHQDQERNETPHHVEGREAPQEKLGDIPPNLLEQVEQCND